MTLRHPVSSSDSSNHQTISNVRWNFDLTISLWSSVRIWDDAIASPDVFVWSNKYVISYSWRNCVMSMRNDDHLTYLFDQTTTALCNTLQLIATHCNFYSWRNCVISNAKWWSSDVFVWSNKYCNTLQHTATHCNTLQHTATHCS